MIVARTAHQTNLIQRRIAQSQVLEGARVRLVQARAAACNEYKTIINVLNK